MVKLLLLLLLLLLLQMHVAGAVAGKKRNLRTWTGLVRLLLRKSGRRRWRGRSVERLLLTGRT